MVNKEKEKLLMKKLMGIPFTTILLHGHTRSPMEITTIEGSNLIPRVINTRIEVYPVILDLEMDSSRSRPDNFQHGVRANNNVVNRRNNNYLHKAASCGDEVRVKDAIGKNKEFLKRQNYEGNLPLHLAVANRHEAVAGILVKEFPQGSYALNGVNISPLYHAVHLKQLNLVKEMFGNLPECEKADVLASLKKGKSIVRAAIRNNDQRMLNTIFKHQRDLIKCTDEEGLTPLSYAAYKGFVDIVIYMINKFPNSVSKYKNEDKSEPIHKACIGGHVEVLQRLLSKSPKSLQSEAELGQTILHLAAKERRNKVEDVVSYLLTLDDGRKLLNKKDEAGFTPLDLAKENKNTEVAQLISGCMPQPH